MASKEFNIKLPSNLNPDLTSMVGEIASSHASGTTEEHFELVAQALAGVMYDIEISSGKVKRTGGLKRLLGVDLAEAEDNVSWWRERIHPEDRERVIALFLSDSDHCEIEYRIRHEQGHYVYVWNQAIILKDEKGQPVRIVGCDIDVTRQKEVEIGLREAWANEQRMRAELELKTEQIKKLQAAEQNALQREREQRAQAEAANRAKDEFLANLSHELRSPLQSILGWINLIRRSKLDPETADRALETIERNTKAQVQIVRDLLDISKSITGKTRLQLKPLDLRKIVERALDSVLPATHAKQIDLKVNYECESAVILGDDGRLQQVFWNLLSNGLKFTPSGGQITVILRSENHSVTVEIGDTGMGIDSDLLPHVFERFRQGDSSSTKEHGGLGLGLAIVKHLVELHGGNVSVESAGRGKGATFRLALPLQKQPMAVPETVSSFQAHEIEVLLKGNKVLVVDDEIDTREFLTRLLSQYGAFVVSAGSAQEALQMAELYGPDVIVSDISMPKEDGYSLLRKFREREVGKSFRTPIIALTARAADTDRARALRAGYEKFFCKPVDPDELVSAIRAVISARLA